MDLRKVLIAVGGVAAVAVISVAAIGTLSDADPAATAETLPETRGVAVTGVGTVSIKPDTSFVDVGVQATADTVEEARAQAADAMNKVIAALKAEGIAEADIQTTSFSIYPQYDFVDNTQTLRGYTVSNSVSARVRGTEGDIGEKTGQVVDAAATAAGNLAVVNGVRFTVEDQDGAMRRAREAAVADAREKAVQLAQLGSVTLGDPIFISEGGSSGTIYAERGMNAAPAADGASPIHAGQLEVSAAVSVTYAIS